jgi:glycosyltransferase involved in cell wall biosynthesis
MGRILEDQLVSGLRARWDDVDLLYCPKSILPFGYDGPSVITIHDLIFLDYPESYSTPWRMYWKTSLHHSIRRAGTVIAVSEATRRKILNNYSIEPERVTVIPGGVDLDRFTDDPSSRDEQLRRKYELPEVYLLYLGSFLPRKNLVRFVRAYASVSDQLPDLVLGGPGGGTLPDIKAALRKSDIEDRIHLPGYIDSEQVPSLLRSARAFVYPSLSEGFGLPLLESFACAVPVLCSDTPALRELGADLPQYVDPLSEEDMAQGLVNLMGKPSRLEAGPDRARDYSWNKIGQRYKELFRELTTP